MKISKLHKFNTDLGLGSCSRRFIFGDWTNRSRDSFSIFY